jgi:hypothetical protein
MVFLKDFRLMKCQLNFNKSQLSPKLPGPAPRFLQAIIVKVLNFDNIAGQKAVLAPKKLI